LIFAFLVLAILGTNPFSPHLDTSSILDDDYTGFATGVTHQGNGAYLVRALTRMPKKMRI